MRHLYSFLMYLLTPYFVLRLWWKGRKLPAYRQRIRERFALNKVDEAEFDIWVHAVSLGEVIAVTPLIEAMLGKQRRILFTSMTPTGSQRIQAQFAARVGHQYIPYDLPCALKHFFKKIKPRIGLIVETELWPNLIHYAKKAGIPLLLINARLSESSFQSYSKLGFLFKPVLNQFHAILAQSKADARRFKALGTDDAKVTVPGNLKFDLETQKIDMERFLILKAAWGSQRPVVILASTHENEEQLILSRIRALQAGLPDMLLLIAPRHPERFQKIYQLSQQMGLNTGLASEPDSLNSNNEVVVLDSLGELLGFYQISDYAFVGGSLVPIGGHNVLEPIAMQVPVFSGTEVDNFKTICRDLKEAQAIELVENADELVARILAVAGDKERRERLITNATRVLEVNKGAIAAYMEKIDSFL